MHVLERYLLGMAADPWTVFAFKQSAPEKRAWWQRCPTCSWWDVTAGHMSGGFCERCGVMVRGVCGRSDESHVFRWVCLNDKRHVSTDSELATHWATWKAGLAGWELLKERSCAEAQPSVRKQEKRPRPDTCGPQPDSKQRCVHVERKL